MKKNILSILMGFICMIESPSFATQFNYQLAFVRELSSSFENSLKLNPPLIPIDMELAKSQHENYIRTLEGIIPQVIRIKTDDAHPDCNFIEDTAILVGDTAVISIMGAVERRGEEIPVSEALKKVGIKKVIHLETPGTMDGGDILYTGKHLFVGLSKRTNEFAFKQLREIFKEKLEVLSVPVTESLHLKSVVSLFDSETLVVATTTAGKKIQDSIELLTNRTYKFIPVPDPAASNVLRINLTLVVQEGFPRSEKILQELCDQKGVNLIKLNMSELIKADGALTCGSLLVNI